MNGKSVIKDDCIFQRITKRDILGFMWRKAVKLIENHVRHSTVASCEVPRLLPVPLTICRPFPACLRRLDYTAIKHRPDTCGLDRDLRLLLLITNPQSQLYIPSRAEATVRAKIAARLQRIDNF